MSHGSVLLRTVVGIGMALAQPALAQDWGRPQGYDQRRGEVATVNYNGGRFVYQGRGRWIEYGIGEQVKASFEEIARERDWIDLNDPTRDVQIRLNIAARMILITERGGPYRPLYPMQSVSNQRPNFGADRPQGGWGSGWRDPTGPIDREVEAGQWLVTQFDAQRVCPGVASRAGGIWTGQYRTTRQAVMSVCTVRMR